MIEKDFSCVVIIILVSVIEGDRCQSLYRLAAEESPGEMVHRNDVKILFNKAELIVEV